MYKVAYLKRKKGNIQLIKITRERIGSKLADLKTGPVTPEGQQNNLSYQSIDIGTYTRVGNMGSIKYWNELSFSKCGSFSKCAFIFKM